MKDHLQQRTLWKVVEPQVFYQDKIQLSSKNFCRSELERITRAIVENLDY